MVALVASSTVTDILKVQTRRRFDKELPMLSRLPEGHAKERVTRFVRRDAPGDHAPGRSTAGSDYLAGLVVFPMFCFHWDSRQHLA